MDLVDLKLIKDHIKNYEEYVLPRVFLDLITWAIIQPAPFNTEAKDTRQQPAMIYCSL